MTDAYSKLADDEVAASIRDSLILKPITKPSIRGEQIYKPAAGRDARSSNIFWREKRRNNHEGKKNSPAHLFLIKLTLGLIAPYDGKRN